MKIDSERKSYFLGSANTSRVTISYILFKSRDKNFSFLEHTSPFNYKFQSTYVSRFQVFGVIPRASRSIRSLRWYTGHVTIVVIGTLRTKRIFSSGWAFMLKWELDGNKLVFLGEQQSLLEFFLFTFKRNLRLKDTPGAKENVPNKPSF